MNLVELIRSWNIPENATTCPCWCICNLQETTLRPDVVNEIVIPFQGNSSTKILQVNNHLCDKPWRVISEYIYLNERTHALTLPVVTSFFRILKVGEPICHVELTDPTQTLQNIKGTYLIRVINKSLVKILLFSSS